MFLNLQYSKTCLKRPLKKKTKHWFSDQLLLNAGQKYCRMLQGEHSAIQSNLSYPNVDYPKLLGYSKTMDSPDFFPIIHCNKTTYYSNFDYPKNSIFRSDSSVPIKENAIKLPFKIRSPNVTHGDHDFFVWLSSINTPE